VLIIDDYYTWSGCRKAVDDYFADKKDGFGFCNKSRLHIIRK
jgi:asparagine synthase (glutamine-hydrolysing)